MQEPIAILAGCHILEAPFQWPCDSAKCLGYLPSLPSDISLLNLSPRDSHCDHHGGHDVPGESGGLCPRSAAHCMTVCFACIAVATGFAACPLPFWPPTYPSAAQVTYKWLSRQLGVAVNESKQYAPLSLAACNTLKPHLLSRNSCCCLPFPSPPCNRQDVVCLPPPPYRRQQVCIQVLRNVYRWRPT